jgi:hypothetical protein
MSRWDPYSRFASHLRWCSTRTAIYIGLHYRSTFVSTAPPVVTAKGWLRRVYDSTPSTFPASAVQKSVIFTHFCTEKTSKLHLEKTQYFGADLTLSAPKI